MYTYRSVLNGQYVAASVAFLILFVIFSALACADITTDYKKVREMKFASYMANQIITHRNYDDFSKAAISLKKWQDGAFRFDTSKRTDHYLTFLYNYPSNKNLGLFDTFVHSFRSANKLSGAVVGFAKGGSLAKGGVEVVEGLLDAITPGIRDRLEARAALLSEETRFRSHMESQANNQSFKTFLAVIDLATKDGSYRDFMNRVYGNKYGWVIKDDGSVKYDDNSSFQNDPVLQLVEQSTGTDGNVTISVEAMQGQFNIAFDTMVTLANVNLAELKTTEAQHKDIIKWMENEDAKAKKREDDEIKQKEYETKTCAARSAVNITSALIGFSDPKLANEVSVTGNAAIQIAGAIHEFKNATTNMKGFASVILTGKILGVVTQLASLLGGGSSPEQEQIAALRQQVEQVRAEMHERFDRVDARLNEILGRLDEVFVRLGEQQTLLYELQNQLATLERELYSFLDDGFRQEFVQGVNWGIGYNDWTGAVLPFQGGGSFDYFANLSTPGPITTPMTA